MIFPKSFILTPKQMIDVKVILTKLVKLPIGLNACDENTRLIGVSDHSGRMYGFRVFLKMELWSRIRTLTNPG